MPKIRRNISIEKEDYDRYVIGRNLNLSEWVRNGLRKEFGVEHELNSVKEKVKHLSKEQINKRKVTHAEVLWAENRGDPNKMTDVVLYVNFEVYTERFGQSLSFEEFREKFPRIKEESKSWFSMSQCDRLRYQHVNGGTISPR